MSFKNNINNLLIKHTIPVLELLLKDISNTYDIDYAELESKYIKSIPMIKKKRNINKKGQMTSYSFFLRDEDVTNKLKEQYPEKSFGEISKLKGNIWRSMSVIDKSRYVEMAKEHKKNKQCSSEEVSEDLSQDMSEEVSETVSEEL